MSEEKRLPKGWAIEELHKITQILDKYRKPINASERLKRIEGKNQKELFLIMVLRALLVLLMIIN